MCASLKSLLREEVGIENDKHLFSCAHDVIGARGWAIALLKSTNCVSSVNCNESVFALFLHIDSRHLAVGHLLARRQRQPILQSHLHSSHSIQPRHSFLHSSVAECVVKFVVNATPASFIACRLVCACVFYTNRRSSVNSSPFLCQCAFNLDSF